MRNKNYRGELFSNLTSNNFKVSRNVELNMCGCSVSRIGSTGSEAIYVTNMKFKFPVNSIFVIIGTN